MTATYLTETANAYSAVAQLYADIARPDLARRPLDRALLAAFAEYVGKSGPVLEAGCGPGHMTAHLHTLGLDVSGIDLAPAMIELAREAHPELRFDVGSMGALDHADASLAGILSWYSVIHTPPAELPAYFAEFRRVLTPGGYLLLAFFATELETDKVTDFDHRVTTAYRWPLEAMAAVVRDAGFEEIGRLSRVPGEDERHRRGHLLLKG